MNYSKLPVREIGYPGGYPKGCPQQETMALTSATKFFKPLDNVYARYKIPSILMSKRNPDWVPYHPKYPCSNCNNGSQ